MTLDELSNVAEILGIIVAISAIILGLGQLRQHRAQRRDLAIMELAHSFEDKEFTDAYLMITSLSEGVTIAELRELDLKYESAAVRVCMKFETVGLLVFRGLVPIDALEELVGEG